jgi:hypothetical protein
MDDLQLDIASKQPTNVENNLYTSAKFGQLWKTKFYFVGGSSSTPF